MRTKSMLQRLIEGVAETFATDSNACYKFQRELKNMYGVRLYGGAFHNADGEVIAKLIPQYSQKGRDLACKIKGYKLEYII